MRRFVSATATGGLALVLFGAAGPGTVVLEVDPGPGDRTAGPVVAALPPEAPPGDAFTVRDADGRTFPAQSIGGEPRRVVMVPGALKGGARHRFRLTGTAPADTKAPQSAECADDGSSLTLKVDGKPVLTYWYATVTPPSGIDPLYRRSGFIHPLRSPSGRVVTADFPADHAHQHGVFFAWVNTTFEGRKVDFWNQKAGTGGVRHVQTLSTTSGPVFAGFSVKLRHEDLTGPRPAAALDEVWTVRVYRVPGRHLIDFESTMTAAGDKALTLNQYHYGGFGLRGHTDWLDPKARGEEAPDPSRSGESDFLTSEGKTRAGGNHTRPRWVDLSGQLGGELAGVTVFDHPSNFRFPQAVRLHPNKPYFCFAPVVDGPFSIGPGSPYRSRYRLDVHDGRPGAKTAGALWDDYAAPPSVRVVGVE